MVPSTHSPFFGPMCLLDVDFQINEKILQRGCPTAHKSSTAAIGCTCRRNLGANLCNWLPRLIKHGLDFGRYPLISLSYLDRDWRVMSQKFP